MFESAKEFADLTQEETRRLVGASVPVDAPSTDKLLPLQATSQKTGRHKTAHHRDDGCPDGGRGTGAAPLT